MHRTNEANLSSITTNLEKLRENFGKWVNLSIVSENKVVVTCAEKRIFQRGSSEIKLGEFGKESSKRIIEKIHSGKKLKARVCDFRPSFLGGLEKDPEVLVSIWET
ncbi:hypothetical protein OA005_00985 [Paracoccaceae bacterium]|nr:hypothetical protein [Paracoccaceae bacterium]